MTTSKAILLVLTLLGATGCSSSHRRRESNQGGIVTKDQEFSLNVPRHKTIKQGGDAQIVVGLDRGPQFKQDVVLELHAQGIRLSPSRITVKASDPAEASILISAGQNAALGDYRVTVKGTPESGRSTTTAFTVSVMSQVD